MVAGASGGLDGNHAGAPVAKGATNACDPANW